jgi:hypothetical protein
MPTDVFAYWPFGLVCLIAIVFVVALVLYARKSEPVGEMKLKWHYIFLWPLLIDWLRKDPKRPGTFFTKRELIGWAVVLLIVVLAIIINPARGS